MAGLVFMLSVVLKQNSLECCKETLRRNWYNEKTFHTLGNILDKIVVKSEMKHIL